MKSPGERITSSGLRSATLLPWAPLHDYYFGPVPAPPVPPAPPVVEELGGFTGPITPLQRQLVRLVPIRARVRLRGLEARGETGQLRATGGGTATVAGVSGRLSHAAVGCTGVQNPTEEQLRALLLLPEVGGQDALP